MRRQRCRSCFPSSVRRVRSPSSALCRYALCGVRRVAPGSWAGRTLHDRRSCLRVRRPGAARPCRGRPDGFEPRHPLCIQALQTPGHTGGRRDPMTALGSRAHDLVVNCDCNPLDDGAIPSGLSRVDRRSVDSQRVSRSQPAARGRTRAWHCACPGGSRRRISRSPRSRFDSEHAHRRHRRDR